MAEITVDLDSGKVTVERYCVAVDVGLIVNPRLLRLNVEGGSAMGIGTLSNAETDGLLTTGGGSSTKASGTSIV